MTQEKRQRALAIVARFRTSTYGAAPMDREPYELLEEAVDHITLALETLATHNTGRRDCLCRACTMRKELER